MIAIRSSLASASVRRLRPGDARHPHGGGREVAEPGARDRARAPHRRPAAEALFAPSRPSPGGAPSAQVLEDRGAERTAVTLVRARAGRRPRRLAAERQLLGTLALAAALAAAALLPAGPPAAADLWLVATALGSCLALLLVGLRLR
jgi:hypothetical protein